VEPVTATHPVAMTARFRELLVVTYAFPPAVLEPLVPASLALEQHDGHGFLAVALVDLDGLRPAALPRRLGVAARFAGYRILVRATTTGGRTRRGLKVLHTDVNRRPLVAGMRLLTRYHASHARIGWRHAGDRLAIRVETPGGRSDLGVIANLAQVPEAPPSGSPFASWALARPFAGPLPWTFAPDPAGASIVLVRGVRDRWDPRPVDVDHTDVALFRQPPFAAATPRLAAAFRLGELDYTWTAGVVEPLSGPPGAGRPR
jgi:uncharacterized protein YqjF (DUF2071 family)